MDSCMLNEENIGRKKIGYSEFCVGFKVRQVRNTGSVEDETPQPV
jgi:hypothetical protein